MRNASLEEELLRSAAACSCLEEAMRHEAIRCTAAMDENAHLRARVRELQLRLYLAPRVVAVRGCDAATSPPPGGLRADSSTSPTLFRAALSPPSPPPAASPPLPTRGRQAERVTVCSPPSFSPLRCANGLQLLPSSSSMTAAKAYELFLRLFRGDVSCRFDSTLFAPSSKASLYRVVSLAKVVQQVHAAMLQSGIDGDPVAAVDRYLCGSTM